MAEFNQEDQRLLDISEKTMDVIHFHYNVKQMPAKIAYSKVVDVINEINEELEANSHLIQPRNRKLDIEPTLGFNRTIFTKI